jgi:hypothetical protein
MLDKNALQASSDLSLLQANYVKGEPTSDYAKSVLDKYKPKPVSSGLNPFSGGNTPATEVPTGPEGGRFPYFSPFVPSNEDLYGSYQSWYSKAGNGIMKGAGLAVTTFLNGTAGLIAGIGNAVSEGKMSSFYDNDFTRSLDSFNDYMENQFPNYYSDKERDANWYSPDNLFTANFLFDKVIKNLGFSVGALGAGLSYSAALRSLGIFSKVASAGGLARSAELSEQMLGAVPEIQQGAATGAGLRTAASEFLGRFNTLNTAQRVVAAGLSTIGEANFEALLQLNDYRQDLIARYVEEHGVRPSGEALAEINRYAENAGNTVFALNLPLLTATNYIQLPKILGSSYRAERNLFTSGVRSATAVEFDRQAGKFVSTLPKSAWGKALYRTKNIASLFFAPSEAFEELSQTSFNFGVENYFNKARRGDNPDVLSDMITAGYGKALTTKEGLESALIGGLSGGIFQFRGNLKQRGFSGFGGQQTATNQAAIAAFNKNLLSGFLNDTRDGVNRGNAIQADRMEAIRRGDFLESRELQTDYTLNYLLPRVQYGRFDLVKDDIDTYRQLASSPEGLQQLKDQGVVSQDTTTEQLLGRIRNMEAHAGNVDELYQALNIRYAGQKNDQGQRVYPDEVISKMVYAAAKVADYDIRIPELSSTLVDYSINVQPILDEMLTAGLPTEASIKPALTQIDNLSILADKREDVRNDLRDLLELSLRRKEFLREYEQLKNKPADYIATKFGPVAPSRDANEIEVAQLNENGKLSPKAVAVGKPYSYSGLIHRDEGGIHINPTVQAGHPSLLGDIRLDYSSGASEYRFPEQFEDLELSDGLSEIELSTLETQLSQAITDTTATQPFADLGLDLSGKDFSEQLRRVNSTNDKDLLDKLENTFADIIYQFEQIRTGLRQLSDPTLNAPIEVAFQQAEASSGTLSTADPVEDQVIIEQLQADNSPRKHISTLFRSSTSEDTTVKGTTENDDFHRRANKFLETLDNLPDRSDIKVALVTVNNQQSLGLDGLIPQTVPGSATSSTDIDEGIIRLVFIRSTPAGDFFVDYEGNALGAVGTKVDYSKLVYTTLPSTSLTWRKNGQPRYISTGKRAATPEKAKTYQDAYRIKRTSFLTRNNGYEVFPFTVSKGFPTYDQTGTQYPVTSSLVSVKELNKSVIVIPTVAAGDVNGKAVGSIIHNEETYNLPLGRPVIQHAAVLSALNNRQLSDREKKVIKKLLVLIADGLSKGTVNRAALNYLQGLIFWKKPAANKTATKGQIWYQSGYLYLGGTQNKVPLLAELIKSSALVDDFLDQVYVSANNFLLTQRSTDSFNEIIDADDNGNLTQVQWKSYQHFLLNPIITTTIDDTSGFNGNTRPVAEIPFTTNIAPVGPTNDPYAATFQQRYITLHSLDLFPHTSSTTPATDIITDDAYKLFIDKNQVAADIIRAIANKVIARQALSSREQAILTGKTSEINKIIADIAQAQQTSTPGEQGVHPAPETVEPITSAGRFTLDGVTLNVFSLNGKDQAKVAAKISPSGEIEITGYENLRKKPPTEEQRQIVIQLVTDEIAQAVLEVIERRKNKKTELTSNPSSSPSNTSNPSAAPSETPQADAPTASSAPTEAPPNTDPSPKGRTAEDIFKNLKARRSGGLTGGQFRLAAIRSAAIEDFDRFLSYVKEVLPGVPVHVVENLIRTTQGGYAWGEFRDKAIYLYRQAELGTGYHEVFEAVFGMFLSDREQSDIIKEFKNRRGSFTDRETGMGLPYSDASNHQAKEQLAEEFREFNLSGALPVAPKAAGFFRRLINFIKSILLGKPLQVRTLFQKINQGYYSKTNFPQRQQPLPSQYRPVIEGLTTRFIHQVMEGMTAIVFEELFTENRSLVELDEYNISLKQLFDKVFARMERYFDIDFPENLLAEIEDAGLDEDEAKRAMAMYADTYNKNWVPIKENWETFTQLNESFLKPFKIFAEADTTQDEKESPIHNEDKSSREYEREILKINARKNAATSVKLLFATLTQVEKHSSETTDPFNNPPDRILSGVEMPQLVNYAKTFNRLLYEVIGAVSPSDMVDRIKQLAIKDSTYVRLFNRLRTAAGYDQLSLYDWKLLIKLYNVLSKQRPDFFIQIQDENNRTFLTEANDNRATSQLASTWIENLKSTAGLGKLVYISNDRFRINTEQLKPFLKRDDGGQWKFDFLSFLGIAFGASDYAKLHDGNKKKFNSAVQRLLNMLMKSGDISTLSGRSLGISGPLTHLAEVVINVSGENNEGQHFNIEGEAVQNIILHNYVSTTLNDINFHSSKPALLNALPHLTDIFSQDSLLLEQGGILYDDNGQRRSDPINISIIEGTKRVGPRAGTPTVKLNLANRRLQEFNQNVNGIYYILLPADSSTEWGINLKNYHYIPFNDFFNAGALSNKLFRIFSKYLATEMRMVADYDTRSHNINIQKFGKSLRFFKGILDAQLANNAVTAATDGSDIEKWVEDNRPKIMEQLNRWIDLQVDIQYNHFREYEIIKALSNNTYGFQLLDGDFRDDNRLSDRMSEEEIRTIIKFRTINYNIHNIELHKVLFGDPALYSDATKRIKSFLSGRESSYHSDEHFNKFANLRLNTTSIERKGIELLPGDPGYWEFKNHMSTITLQDINTVGSLALSDDLAEDIRSAYSEANEADAQSWISLPAYRELLLKAGGRWTDAMERQYQYEMAYERWSRFQSGTFEYGNRDALKNHDQTLFTAGNPSYAIFHPIKPIGTGVKSGAVFSDIFLDKTSALPIYHRVSEGRNLGHLYREMSAQGISYAIMESGRKVGAQQLQSLYNADGSLAQLHVTDRINVPFKYFGIQLETAGSKVKQTRGTQLTKLAIINLMASGVPTDVELDYATWQDLSEDEKRAASPIYDLVSRNTAILDAMTEKGYQQVLEQLGIQESENGFEVIDYKILADYLSREAENRDLPENIRDGIGINPETGQFLFPLETLANYRAVKSMVYSIVDKKLLRPKLPGGPKVQVSSAMFESNNRQAVYKPGGNQAFKWEKVENYNLLSQAEKDTVRLTSNDLKFYSKDEPWIEVLMPHWFKAKLQRNGINKTDKELIRYLEKHGTELLTGIGFRIPTQELNSVEHIRIKGFLPQEMGDSIVVPTEIVVKAGSDFDIDKLNTYLKNFFINTDGFPQVVPFLDVDMATEQGRRDLYDHFYGKIDRFLRLVERELAEKFERGYIEEENEDGLSDDQSKMTKSLFTSLSGDLERIGIDPTVYERKREQYIPFESFEKLIAGKNLYQVYAELDPAALENEYINTLQQLLSLPQNFERLIQPNSAEELKALRNELNTALGKASLETKGNFSLLLDPNYMSEVRHNFISGKGGVGIAALQQTNTAISQISGLLLDHRNFKDKLSLTEKKAVDEVSVKLPHNTVKIGDETFITISSIKDTIGRYISDKISAYINGYVDIAKDAFIVELGANMNVARIYLFLEKIGVPTRDVVMFMNQPIIQDYLKILSVNGINAVHSEYTIKHAGSTKRLYPTKKTGKVEIDTTSLKANIEKKSSGKKFTDEENAIQQEILKEFLKYAVFSDHLFAIAQSSSYDTDRIGDAAMVFRKQTLSDYAHQYNLFNSIDKIYQHTFIGKIKDRLSDVKLALGNIFLLDDEVIGTTLQEILGQYIQPYQSSSEDDFLVITSKLQSSFLDYITQSAGIEATGNLVEQLMIGERSVATELVKLKHSIPSDSDLAGNVVLSSLEPMYDNTFTNEPQNIRLKEKPYDSFTANLYTEAMRDLRNNVHTGDFYKRLITLSLLQSGSRRSPISFTEIIPLEDYAPLVKKALNSTELATLLRAFADINAFQRVHYWDERIVPTIEAKESTYDGTVPIYNVPDRLYKNLNAKPGESRFIRLNTQYQSRESNYPVVKIREIAVNPLTKAPYSLQEQSEMRKNGDYSFFKYTLFKKVMTEGKDGQSVGLSFPDDQNKRPGVVNYIYKQINTWGKPGLVQEYYNYPRPSVIESNQKVREFSDEEVVSAYRNTSAFLQLRDDGSQNNIIPSQASASTLSLVNNFLDKIGVSVKGGDAIMANGRRVDAAGLADITQRLIQIANGSRIETTLPEEAMHFAVEIISQKHPALFSQLLKEVNKYHLYNEILSTYGQHLLYQLDGKPDIIKLKKEAIARLLVETIILRNEGATEKPELLAKVSSWWQKIIEFLKNLFNRAGFNPFEKAASLVIEDKLSDQEGELALGNAGVYLQQSGKQADLVSRVLNMHSQLSKEVSESDSSDSYYVLGGKRVSNRVTNLAKKYYDRKFRNKQISETELQKALNDQKKEKGTDGHADLEDIFHRLVDENGSMRPSILPQTLPSRLEAKDNSYYKTLEANMIQRLQSFKAGSRFFSELMIYDADTDTAGTIDFLAIEPDNADGTAGKIHILDWKFINLKEDAIDIPFYKKEAWNIQISEYIKMLTKPVYGVNKGEFGMTRAIPIKALYSFEDKERTQLKLFGIEIGNVNVSTISDDTLLPVPTTYESTGNNDLDALIYSLNNLHEKIFEHRTDPGTEYQRTQRLNDILLAIRRLQLKKEAGTLFKFAKNDIYNFNTFFKKYFELLESGNHNLSDKEINDLAGRILEAEDVLSLYKDFNITFRKIFSYQEPGNKVILQESEMISDDAELVLTRLLRLANSLRTNPIARGLEVDDVLEPEKVITWYQKWVRSLSQGATKATEILWGIVNRINTAVQIEFSDEMERLKTLEAEVSQWIKSSGNSFADLSDMIFAKDHKGRWTGKVISAVDSEFYTALNDAQTQKNKSWIYDNIDLVAYKQWFDEQLEQRRKTFQTSRLMENEQDDADLKAFRLQEFSRFFDIETHPDTAITVANYKLKSFPIQSKWKSKEFDRLTQPDNKPVWMLYDYWQQQLKKSYDLGMIKSWEQKTFFPNVRKDFLDKLVFGAQTGIAKNANLAFLNQLRIEANDEVFGYTDINGNPQDRLSAMYVYDLGNKVTDKDGETFTDYSNKSTDIFKVMALWNKELIKYQHKSEVIDTVRLLHFTEKNRKAIARSKKTGGIAYKENGQPVYVDNVENSEYFKNYMDYYFYGKRLSEGQDVTFHFRYNALAEKVNKFFHADILPKSEQDDILLSGRKTIRAFNRFFQMKTLGFNLATAVTNMLGGKVNAYMLAGKFFTKADYAKAALQLASAKFHTQEGAIHAGLLNYFLPLTDDRTGERVRELSASRAIKLLASDHLFYMMRSSDKMVQYPVALAMFANTMVEDGKLVNIREYVKRKHNYAGIYQLTPSEQKSLRKTIEAEIEELKATRSLPVITRIEEDKAVIDGISRTQKDIADFRNQIQQFSKDALGNMSEDDISQYRLTLLGQSFMMFKNWIPRMADVRFGEFRYQAGTESYEWGRVSMLFNALKHGILTGAKASLGTLVGSNEGLIEIAQKVYAAKKAEYEANGLVFKMSEADFIDMYVKGIRTQLKEVAVMLSMMGLLLFAKSEVPDDDDERTSGFYKWLIRTLDKMTDELGFFLNPLSFTAIANGSVFPSVQLLNDIVKFTNSLTLESYYMAIGDEKAVEKNKVAKYLFKTFPVTKELMTYTAMFNEDLAKEYGITLSNRARMR